MPAPQTITSEIATFAMRWGLDTESIKLMMILPEHSRQRVITEFNPHHDTRNVNGKLKTFVNSMMPKAADATVQPGSLGMKWMTGAQPESLKRPRVVVGDLTDPVAAFIAQWQLTPDAAQLMYTLPPECQQIVIQEFAPRGDTRDVSAKLKVFAQQIMERAASGMEWQPTKVARMI